MLGIKIYNDKGLTMLDSTNRTPLLLGETELLQITSNMMKITLPAFLSSDPSGIIAIVRIVNSNSSTNGVVKSITASGVNIFFKASKYKITTSGAVALPVDGSFIITFYRG